MHCLRQPETEQFLRRTDADTRSTAQLQGPRGLGTVVRSPSAMTELRCPPLVRAHYDCCLDCRDRDTERLRCCGETAIIASQFYRLAMR